jgi:hypothetical protein
MSVEVSSKVGAGGRESYVLYGKGADVMARFRREEVLARKALLEATALLVAVRKKGEVLRKATVRDKKEGKTSNVMACLRIAIFRSSLAAKKEERIFCAPVGPVTNVQSHVLNLIRKMIEGSLPPFIARTSLADDKLRGAVTTIHSTLSSSFSLFLSLSLFCHQA